MNILWEELTAGLTNHDHLLRVFLRLFAAILLGGLIGLQRVSATKPTGLRTHTLVCLGTTVIVLSASTAALSPEGISRVIQGIVTGIGFIGAGSILKLSEEHLVHGLTASARVWTNCDRSRPTRNRADHGHSHHPSPRRPRCVRTPEPKRSW